MHPSNESLKHLSFSLVAQQHVIPNSNALLPNHQFHQYAIGKVVLIYLIVHHPIIKSFNFCISFFLCEQRASNLTKFKSNGKAPQQRLIPYHYGLRPPSNSVSHYVFIEHGILQQKELQNQSFPDHPNRLLFLKIMGRISVCGIKAVSVPPDQHQSIQFLKLERLQLYRTCPFNRHTLY